MMTLEKTLKGEDLFDSLAEEMRHDLRSFKVKKNKHIEPIIFGFLEFLKEDIPYHDREFQVGGFIPRHCTSSQILDFSIELEKFVTVSRFFDYTPTFLNALIKNCDDNEVYINLSLLKNPLNDFITVNPDRKVIIYGDVGRFVGSYLQTGEIIIKGNSGNALGYKMGGGKITVEKNTGEYAGMEMSGEEILILGNAGDCIGHSLRGGKIKVNGNVGRSIGFWMTDGEIHIGGDIPKSDYLYEYDKTFGSVYHKGKLFVENGAKLKC